MQIMFSADEIADRVRSLARNISGDFGDHPVCIIAIANGATLFTADLMRQLPGTVFLDTIKTSFYASGSTGRDLHMDCHLKMDLRGKHVLLIDDILDTGCTMKAILEYLRKENPAELKTCVLLNKPSRRKVPIEPDYFGFSIPDRFVFGYGLDDENGCFRNLPYIAGPDPI